MVSIWHPNNYYSNWHKRSLDFVFVRWTWRETQEIKNPDTPITVHWGSPLLILFFDFNSGGRPNLSTHFKLLSKTSLFFGMIFSSRKSRRSMWNNPYDGRDGGLVSSLDDKVIQQRCQSDITQDSSVKHGWYYTQSHSELYLIKHGQLSKCYLLTLFADFLWDEFHGCVDAGKAICVAVNSGVSLIIVRLWKCQLKC